MALPSRFPTPAWPGSLRVVDSDALACDDECRFIAEQKAKEKWGGVLTGIEKPAICPVCRGPAVYIGSNTLFPV